MDNSKTTRPQFYGNREVTAMRIGDIAVILPQGEKVSVNIDF